MNYANNFSFYTILATNLVLFRHTYGLIYNPFKSEQARFKQDLQLLLLLLVAVAGFTYADFIADEYTFIILFIVSVSAPVIASSVYMILCMYRLRNNGMNDNLKSLLRNRIISQWLYDFAASLDSVIPLALIITGSIEFTPTE